MNSEVCTKSMLQMLDESAVMTRDYLERAIPEIQNLANALYQNRSKETWDKLVQFIEGLQWLIKMAGYFQNYQLHPHFQAFNQFITSVQSRLNEFETALSGSDQVLMADLLTYEFLPALEVLRNSLKQDENGEAANDLN